jgi:Family of unknown function (DUF6412)
VLASGMTSVLALLRAVVALVGQAIVGGVPAASVVLVGMIGAVAVIAVAVTARLASLSITGATEGFPSTDVDLPVRLSQSNPDADGHPRARAPGFAA